MAIATNPDEDVFHQFIQTCCIQQPNYNVSRIAIYIEYRNFLIIQKEQPLNMYEFIKKMKLNGFNYNNLIFFGLKLKELDYKDDVVGSIIE